MYLLNNTPQSVTHNVIIIILCYKNIHCI